MTLELELKGIEPKITLTTEHAASSYGIPVAIVDDKAYGPADHLPEGIGDLGFLDAAESLGQMVLVRAHRLGLSDHPLVVKFLR